MGRRSVSPARSEVEVDIAGDLFLDDEEIAARSGFGRIKQFKKTGNGDPAVPLDFNDLLNTGGDDGWEDDGDEAFIASKMRSSNRKTTNAQGKTTKKGGGFQAMGKWLASCSAGNYEVKKLTLSLQASAPMS